MAPVTITHESPCVRCGAVERDEDKRCRPCNRAKARRQRAEFTSADWRKKNLWTFYRMAVEDYDLLLASQGGGCAVCQSTVGLSVDHDHACCAGPQTCGECVRGILCRACNRAEGMLRSDPSLIRRLAEYIERRT